MPSKKVQIFTRSAGITKLEDIRYLITSNDITDVDIIYFLNYINDNISSIPIDTMVIHGVCSVLYKIKRRYILVDFLNKDSLWTPYILSVSLIETDVYLDHIELYSKYRYQIYQLIISNSNILSTIGEFDHNKIHTIFMRVHIKACINDLDYITLNRLEALKKSLIFSRDKYDLVKFLTHMYKLKDVNERFKVYLDEMIIEFCDPTKRRCYSSLFLRELYSLMTRDKFRTEFHLYIESLFNSNILNTKDFVRFDKAYLESNEN